MSRVKPTTWLDKDLVTKKYGFKVYAPHYDKWFDAAFEKNPYLVDTKEERDKLMNEIDTWLEELDNE